MDEHIAEYSFLPVKVRPYKLRSMSRRHDYELRNRLDSLLFSLAGSAELGRQSSKLGNTFARVLEKAPCHPRKIPSTEYCPIISVRIC